MPATWSLKRRLLITGTLVVGTFMLLAGFALEQAFRSSAEQARTDRLQARIYMLIALTEVIDGGNVEVPDTLPDPELAVPDSGVYSSISSNDGSILWQSQSSLGDSPDYPHSLKAGETIHKFTATEKGTDVATLSLPIIWEVEDGVEVGLIFHAGESDAKISIEIQAFRNSLQKWLGGAAIVLLGLQLLLLIWVTKPLNQVSKELREVESGSREQLSRDYPAELTQLTGHLNDLVHSNQKRLQRYRNSLSDLAHSLKTPLTSARLQIDAQPGDNASVLAQLDDINATIDYQLQRASASGRSPLAQPIEAEETIQRIAASLRKVYRDKQLQLIVDVAPQTVFNGETGDLAEIAGNLCDNACKWATSKVVIKAENVTAQRGANSAGNSDEMRLKLTVSDDGEGIPEAMRISVLARGVRADTRRPGQGIGLATVRDIVVEVYGGQIEIDASESGGARISVEI